jgi:chromosome segregation ATPase
MTNTAGERPANDPTVAELQRRIALLERRLAARGTGAYRNGPALALGGAGSSDESLLDRLHRLEGDLSSSSGNLEQQRRQIENLRQQLLATKTLGGNLEQQLAVLGEVEDRNQILVQELRATRERLAALERSSAGSELSRLRTEKAYYELAAQVIVLQRGDPNALRQLQERLRQSAPRQRPGDLGAPEEHAADTHAGAQHLPATPWELEAQRRELEPAAAGAHGSAPAQGDNGHGSSGGGGNGGGHGHH